MRFGSLFSGIGGMDLGLERAGMQCVWQVEIDDYATRVLEKHWPTVPRFRDVREVGKHNLEPVDIIAGGFPCQDVSNAGTRTGLDGKRSGLWFEFHRIICELRPRIALIENSSALLVRGMERVLCDLSSCGYDAEWQVLSAAAFGAAHERERLFIIAYPSVEGRQRVLRGHIPRVLQTGDYAKKAPSNPLDELFDLISSLESRLGEPSIFGTADGLTDQLDRLATVGNAVVPQVAEWIGKRIMESSR